MPTETLGPECAAQLGDLRDWVASRTGRAPTETLADEGGAQVLVHPVGVRPATPSGPTTRNVSSAEVLLRVLVSAVGGGAVERSCLTTDLALHALEDGRWRVHDQGPDLALWASLGLTARPGLLLDLPVRRLLDRPPAPAVREPLHVDSMPIRELTGRVVAPDGTPVPSAVLTVLPTGPSATSDHRGRFAMTTAIPTSELYARIRARGKAAQFRLDPAADGAVGDLVLTGLPSDPTDQSTPAATQEV